MIIVGVAIASMVGGSWQGTTLALYALGSSPSSGTWVGLSPYGWASQHRGEHGKSNTLPTPEHVPLLLAVPVGWPVRFHRLLPDRYRAR